MRTRYVPIGPPATFRNTAAPSWRVKACIAFFAALVVEAFWNASPIPSASWIAPVVFCGTCTAALNGALRRQQTLLAVFVAQVGLAYSLGSVDASANGTELMGMLFASGRSVDAGLAVATVFVVFVSAAAALANRAGALRSGGMERRDAPGRLRPYWMALLVVFGACLVAAIVSGTWTFYGGAPDDQHATGGIRPQLLYVPLLMTMLLVVWREIVAAWAHRGNTLAPWFAWSVMGILLLLGFLVQMRRVVITFAVFAVVWLLQSRLALRGLIQTPRRFVAVLLVTTVAALATFVGSPLWRDSVIRLGDAEVTLQQRLTDILENRALPADENRILERMTYLGLDAAAVEYRGELSGSMSFSGILGTTIIAAMPAIVFPTKYAGDGTAHVETCEEAFLRIGVDEDLPCTPEAEALLAGGVAGVAALGVLWGVALAALSALLRRSSFPLTVATLVVFSRMAIIETSAFPFIPGARDALMIWIAVVVGGLALRPFLGGTGPTRRPLPRPITG